MANKLRKKIISKYTDVDSPGSFTSLTRFRKENFPDVPIEVVKNALSTIDAYTRHKSYKHRFRRRKTQTYGVDKQWQIDLIDMRDFKRENSGFSYILVAIDVFSRYAFAQPVRTKGGDDVVEAFKLMTKERKCHLLQSDKGMEFRNSKFIQYLSQKGISLFHSENDDIKCALVERLNRTLQDKLWKIFTYTNSHRWVDVLQNVVKSYNNTIHSSLGITPSEVNSDNSDALHFKLYEKIPKKIIYREWRSGQSRTLKVKDKVRLLETKKTFNRGYEPNWSEEIYIIYKIGRRGYYLKDMNGEVIKGSFYAEELQKVKVHWTKQYSIEKIVKYRGTGKKREAYIKWKGYSDDFNTWEPASSVKDI